MDKQKQNNSQKAYIVAVDMGYGHQRAAYPLKKFAYGGIINANNYPGIPPKDWSIWRKSRLFYEWISKFKKVPFLGPQAFKLFDKLQSIPMFYPKRDLSAPIFQVKQMYNLIKRYQWGKHLIDKMEKHPLPLVTTFFATAFMAEVYDYSQEIYCVVTDTDISRSWVSINPSLSRINYLAPCSRVVERLKLYGVRSEKIFLTGFPLPMENIGDESLDILRADLGDRLCNLDPGKKYLSAYKETIKKHLGEKNCHFTKKHLLTIMFAVGGAAAQRDLGVEILKSLKKKISMGEVRIILVAGIHNAVNSFFRKNVRKLGLGRELDKGILTIFAGNKDDYFKRFNQALRQTDILWTKPSELSFYAALGIPIIMAPSIGSQEEFNKEWLLTIAAGLPQKDPRYTDQWLFDWLDSGWFAEAAMEGFLEAPKFGTYNIGKIISKKVEEVKEMKTVFQY